MGGLEPPFFSIAAMIYGKSYGKRRSIPSKKGCCRRLNALPFYATSHHTERGLIQSRSAENYNVPGYSARYYFINNPPLSE